MYEEKECFKVINGNTIESVTYKDVWNKIIQIGQALSNIELNFKHKIVVGIFSENSLRGALIDLSCFKRLCKQDFTKFDGHFSRLSKRIFVDNLLI